MLLFSDNFRLNLNDQCTSRGMQFREFPTTICKYIDIYMLRVNFRMIGASSSDAVSFMEHAQGSPENFMSSCYCCRPIIISYLIARVSDVYTLATSAISCGLHVAKYTGKSLSQILHCVFGVFTRSLRLTTLSMKRHSRRKWWFFSTSADGRRAAYRA